jgi:hypothetical protein
VIKMYSKCEMGESGRKGVNGCVETKGKGKMGKAWRKVKIDIIVVHNLLWLIMFEACPTWWLPCERE